MASILEDIIAAVKTRLELIKTTAGYNYFGTLQSVQLLEHKWEGGERSTVNGFTYLPTIIVRDLGELDEVDTDHTWVATISLECWFVTDDGSALALIRAYDDMRRALDPTAFGPPLSKTLTEPRYTRAYTDPVTQQALDGVILNFEAKYHVNMSDPTVE